MGVNTGVRVEGLKETLAAVRRAGVDIADLKEGFTAVGNEVVKEAQSVAPRRTGRMANTIRTSKRFNGVIISAGGARAPYAPYVHFGTKHMAGRRFIYQALNRANLEEDLQRVIETALRRAGL